MIIKSILVFLFVIIDVSSLYNEKPNTHFTLLINESNAIIRQLKISNNYQSSSQKLIVIYGKQQSIFYYQIVDLNGNQQCTKKSSNQLTILQWPMNSGPIFKGIPLNRLKQSQLCGSIVSFSNDTGIIFDSSTTSSDNNSLVSFVFNISIFQYNASDGVLVNKILMNQTLDIIHMLYSQHNQYIYVFGGQFDQNNAQNRTNEKGAQNRVNAQNPQNNENLQNPQNKENSQLRQNEQLRQNRFNSQNTYKKQWSTSNNIRKQGLQTVKDFKTSMLNNAFEIKNLSSNNSPYNYTSMKNLVFNKQTRTQQFMISSKVSPLKITKDGGYLGLNKQGYARFQKIDRNGSGTDIVNLSVDSYRGYSLCSNDDVFQLRVYHKSNKSNEIVTFDINTGQILQRVQLDYEPMAFPQGIACNDKYFVTLDAQYIVRVYNRQPQINIDKIPAWAQIFVAVAVGIFVVLIGVGLLIAFKRKLKIRMQSKLLKQSLLPNQNKDIESNNQFKNDLLVNYGSSQEDDNVA